jgi:hypothetical protein
MKCATQGKEQEWNGTLSADCRQQRRIDLPFATTVIIAMKTPACPASGAIHASSKTLLHRYRTPWLFDND